MSLRITNQWIRNLGKIRTRELPGNIDYIVVRVENDGVANDEVAELIHNQLNSFDAIPDDNEIDKWEGALSDGGHGIISEFCVNRDKLVEALSLICELEQETGQTLKFEELSDFESAAINNLDDESYLSWINGTNKWEEPCNLEKDSAEFARRLICMTEY